MKIQSHRPLRSNFPSSTFKKTKELTKGDVLHSVRTRNAEKNLVLLRTLMKPDYTRIGRVKRASLEGVKGFHCVGLGFVAGTFEELKKVMKTEKFTGLKMGIINVDLRG